MKQIPILHTDVRGHGPTVVLLHGFLASSRYWSKVSELVAKDYKVIAFDLLGFGDSPKPRGNAYDYADHITSINATLKELGVNEPFILMGHSMGSLIALRYATLYDERVRKLMLINMPVMLGAQEVRDELIRPNFMYKLGLMNVTHRFMWPAMRGLYRTKLLPRKAMGRINESSAYMFQHNAASRIRSFRNVIRDARVDLDLNAVKVKTIIVSGIDDRKIYIENLLSNIQLSPYVALENIQTGHHIPRIMPEFLLHKLNEK